MIKTLQKKFVITAMTAITVLILLLLGAINIANIVIVRNEVEHTMQMLSDSEGEVGNLKPMPNMAPHGSSAGMERNDYDTFMASNFFIVRFDDSGSAVYVDVSRTSAVTEESAVKMAETVLQSNSASGKSGKYRYRMTDTRMVSGKAIVFLDTSNDIVSYIRVLLLSAAIGIVCWGLMLVFVILLSKRAIRPIAENIEKQKQFVTNAGHEIKTPLAIIQSNTEAMELYNGENKWSRNIKEQTVRLSGLMKNLLMLARTDEGAAQAVSSELPLSDLLSDMTKGFVPLMDEKHIKLHTDIQPDVILRADKGQTEQLVSILLDNAVKYTNDSGKIGIELQKSEKQIKLTVRNTCENLPNVTPDKLFDRFYRADAARTQKSGGYGIGLSVAQSITAANKGSISAEYIGDDIICFTVRFQNDR